MHYNEQVERVKEDSRLKKISNVALTVGGLASSTKGQYGNIVHIQLIIIYFELFC